MAFLLPSPLIRFLLSLLCFTSVWTLLIIEPPLLRYLTLPLTLIGGLAIMHLTAESLVKIIWPEEQWS